MPDFQIREWLRKRLETRRARRITVAGARGRARRGAEYLDEVAPGWAEVVDPWALDLAHRNSCVLGQLHGSFSIGLGRAGLFSLSSAPRASFSPVDLGFHCMQGVCDALQEQDYEYLNQAWHEEIEQRAGEQGLFAPRFTLHGPDDADFSYALEGAGSGHQDRSTQNLSREGCSSMFSFTPDTHAEG